ncbi:MAG: hypothetical protein ACO3EE_07710 [Flavobacteriales bacterium]
MKYTLITSGGKIMQFYGLQIAELYKLLNGGVIVTNEILDELELEEVEMQNAG